MGASMRVAVVFLLAFAAGCGHGGDSKQQAALDQAYQSGVITKSEYDAKKAALAQLVALDKARDAGILTQAEYDQRKQRLGIAAPPPPPSAGSPVSTPVSTPMSAPGAAAPDSPMQPVSAIAPTPAAPIGSAPVSSGGLRQEHIFDPHLGLNAYDVSVPANWKFNGAFVPGSSCGPIPFPVFRIYSPDGLSEIRRLPRFDWRWSNSKFAPKQQNDCLDLKQDMPVDDFMKYLMATMQVAYVRDYPIPQEAKDNFQKGIEQFNTQLANSAAQLDRTLPNMKGRKSEPATQHGALAAAIAEYRNGTFTIEEEIGVRLMCMHSPINYGPETGTSSDSCNATVRIVRAPKGSLEAVLAMDKSEGIGAKENPDWVQKYMQYQNAQWKAMSDKMFADSNARMKSQHDEFERGQAMRAQQHQQFLSTMQEGTNRSMARATEAANSRHAIAQDWADYVLDQQTVTGAGGTVKISNAYNNTWTDGSGHYYQTNDPNTNPNGVLSGNWTMTTQVHGDGTAK
jgi:hypothetical protein